MSVSILGFILGVAVGLIVPIYVSYTMYVKLKATERFADYLKKQITTKTIQITVLRNQLDAIKSKPTPTSKG